MSVTDRRDVGTAVPLGAANAGDPDPLRAGGGTAVVGEPSLTADQCARYAAEGFLAPLDALSAGEAAACRDQLARHLDRRGLADPRLRNNPHLLFTWAADLVRHPCIVGPVAALIGPDVLVRNAVLFIKPPRDRGYNAWHQDGAYWDLEGERLVTAWIALTDSTAANGAVRVLPGSHRGPRLAHELRTDPHARLLRGQAITGAAADAVTIELRAGQFSLHDPWVVHGSPANASAVPRIGLAVRYMAPDLLARGPRQGSATLVRGSDHLGRHQLEPRPRRDFDPLAGAAHRRRLRRYALHVAWQLARQPTWANLRLLGRLGLRAEFARALLGRGRG